MIICCCHFLEHVKHIKNIAFGTCEAQHAQIAACRDFKNITQRLKSQLNVVGIGTSMKT
jgi:hypothetical protein